MARRTLYERARAVLAEQSREDKPALPQAKINRERLALEDAVLKLEVEATQRVQERLAALKIATSVGTETTDSAPTR